MALPALQLKVTLEELKVEPGCGLSITAGPVVGVGVGVGLGVGVGVGVGVRLGAAAQYLPPVFKEPMLLLIPPQTII